MAGDVRLVWYRGAWAAYWRENGRPRRRSLGTADRGKAERKLRDAQRLASQGGPAETIGEMVEAFIQDKEHQGKPSAPINRHAWNAMRADFAHLYPRHITREFCRDYIARCRERGLSDATIRYRLATVQAAVRFHGRHSEAVFELPSEPAPRDRYLTRNEARRLIDAARSVPHIHVFIVLALTTAARPEALLELTWDRVDLERGRINLGRGRGSKKRAVAPPINRTARRVLEAARQAATTDYVIEYGGKPVKSVKRGVAGAAERAGLEDVTPYVLRHTAAVWMAADGVDLEKIRDLMGHSSTRVTERVYAKYHPEHMRDASEALELDEHGDSDDGI